MIAVLGLEPVCPPRIAPPVELDPDFHAWLDRVTFREPARGVAELALSAAGGRVETSAREVYLSWWRPVAFSATVMAPAHGSWHVRVRDAATGRVLHEDDAARPGVAVAFTAHTGFKLRPVIEARWSEDADTTLAIHVEYRY